MTKAPPEPRLRELERTLYCGNGCGDGCSCPRRTSPTERCNRRSVIERLQTGSPSQAEKVATEYWIRAAAGAERRELDQIARRFWLQTTGGFSQLRDTALILRLKKELQVSARTAAQLYRAIALADESATEQMVYRRAIQRYATEHAPLGGKRRKGGQFRPSRIGAPGIEGELS